MATVLPKKVRIEGYAARDKCDDNVQRRTVLLEHTPPSWSEARVGCAQLIGRRHSPEAHWKIGLDRSVDGRRAEGLSIPENDTRRRRSNITLKG